MCLGNCVYVMVRNTNYVTRIFFFFRATLPNVLLIKCATITYLFRFLIFIQFSLEISDGLIYVSFFGAEELNYYDFQLFKMVNNSLMKVICYSIRGQPKLD